MASWLVLAPWEARPPRWRPSRNCPRARIDDLAPYRGMQTFGDESHFAFAAVTQNHAEFVACGASDNVAAAQGLRKSLAGGDDHFVGGIKAVGLVDDRKLIDGSDKICASALSTVARAMTRVSSSRSRVRLRWPVSSSQLAR